MHHSRAGTCDDAERRLTHLGAAAGSLAHDLQNLMLVLRLDAGRIARVLGDGHAARPEGLMESLDEMDTLVARLSRLSESQQSVVGASQLLRRVVNEACAWGVDVESRWPDELPEVQCDPLLLRLALVHLLSGGAGRARIHADTDADGRLVVETRTKSSGDELGRPSPSHSEFGLDPGDTLVERAVRLARGTLARNSEAGVSTARIVLPPATRG